MSNFRLEKIKDRRGFALCAYMRTMVYVIEQNCPPLMDFDALDNEAEHYLGWAGEEPVCCCRTLMPEQDVLKIGRIVTLKAYRGKGYATQMLREVIEKARINPAIKSVKMSAQLHAIGLYEKLGFETYGEEYIEDKLTHRMMKLDLREAA